MTELRGAGPLRQTARSVRTGRVLLVGDAAGYVDALTGEGLATGCPAAREAVAAIADGRPERLPGGLGPGHPAVPAAHRGPARPHRAGRSAARCWCPAAARLPRVFGAAVDLLA